jgi:PD-(D/E)XK nuclease superfamily
MALYTNADGIPVTTQSMISCFRRCPRDAYYKYKLRLKPKRVRKELTRGKWFHAMLEAHLQGQDWRVIHRQWTNKFNKLFDEEKEELGDLPNEILRLWKGYLWHYGDPQYEDYEWTVHEVERTLEAELPNGHIFRCRVDAIVENDFGLWAVDHKSHKRMPDWEKRMLDEQSPLYIWCCWQNDIPVEGFVWNYIVTTGISVPKVVKNGSRFYSRVGDSDYPTYVKAVKAAKAEWGDVFLGELTERDKVKAEAARLLAQRWTPDAIPASPHYRRDVIGADQGRVERVLKAATRTSDRMHSYNFDDPDCIERNVGQCRSWICDYASLSLTDLLVGDSTMVQKRDYRTEDPLAYYDNEEEGM